MTTDTTRTRANRLGDPCPPWCTMDHTKLLVKVPEVYIDHHGSGDISPCEYPFTMRVRVTLSPYSTSPRIVTRAGGGYAYVSLEYAEDLAALLDGLADASPEQIRALAADVRAAARLLEETK